MNGEPGNSLKEEFEDYTVPTIIMPNGEYIMNTLKIADALEAAYPQPSLRLESPYRKKALPIMISLWDALEPMILTHVNKRLLNEVNQDFWRETREPWLGKSLEEAEKELDNDVLFKNAGPHIDQMTELLKENEGPFFLGADVGFADFQWAGFLIFIRRIGEDKWESLKSVTAEFEVHEKLLEAVKPWAERDSY